MGVALANNSAHTMGGVFISSIGSSSVTSSITTPYVTISLDWVINQTSLKYTLTRVDDILIIV